MQAAAPAVFGVPLDFILFALALLGVAVMCGLGILTEADAFKYVDWNVLAILVGIWIIAGYFGKTAHWIDGSPENSGLQAQALAQLGEGLFSVLIN